jgi:mRNA-degrading endonuclease toxin of MazEF toxin-antitoxin module
VFPEEKAGQPRNTHPTRYAILLSNKEICSSEKSPVVLMAPLSKNVHVRAESDLWVGKTDKNGFVWDSRAALSHVQPILKQEIEEHLGTLSEADLVDVKAKLVFIFDLSD